MNGRTRYGHLLRDAARPVAAANAALAVERFPGPNAAREAMVAYRDLLHALGRHGWALLGPAMRVEAMRASGTPDHHGLFAARMVEELGRGGRAAAIDRRTPSSLVAAHWAGTAASVRAATDLLGTHRDRRGLSRSPLSAQVDTPQVRAAGLTQLAGLVVPVAEAALALARRSGEADVTWEQVRRMVPDTADLTREAIEVRRLGPNAPEALAALGGLEVARPAVRTGDPLVELGDRLARLHRLAWQLTTVPRVGVGTLTDFAVAGVVLNEHAERLLRPDLASSTPSRGSGAPNPWDVFQRAAAAWRLIHADLSRMRTATPPNTAVRADVRGIRRLLAAGPQPAGADGAAPTARVEPVILGGARAFGQIGVWNAQVLSRQASNGLLFTPGHCLTGDEITDKPELVAAKLNGGIASTQIERVDNLRAAYTTVRRSAAIGARLSSPGTESRPVPGVER